MIEHLISSNNIKLHESSDIHNKALRLMTSLITGDCVIWNELLKSDEMFLTEIVSNKFCNIDVDKCDYILRDDYHVKDHVTLKPCGEFLARAKIVFDDEGISHIGYHAKDFNLIENLFYNRAYLHMNIYQHKRVAAAEKMVKDICSKSCAGGVTINGLPLTEVHRNSDAYLKLEDSVLEVIQKSDESNDLIKEAKQILKNLNEDRIYEMVWESIDDDGADMFEVLVKKFGKKFVNVGKFIPSAEVPTNVPLYNDDGDNVKMTSDLKLSYKSSMIYCVDPDIQMVADINSFIDSMNNNL
jgi:HD superfamily phosphohydrolase